MDKAPKVKNTTLVVGRRKRGATGRGSLRGILGTSKQEQVAETGGESRNPEQKDPMVEYMEQSNHAIDALIAQPMKASFGEIRAMRNYIVCAGDLQKNHPKLIEMVQKIDGDSWKMVENTKRVGRRLATQEQKLAKNDSGSSCQVHQGKEERSSERGRKNQGCIIDIVEARGESSLCSIEAGRLQRKPQIEERINGVYKNP